VCVGDQGGASSHSLDGKVSTHQSITLDPEDILTHTHPWLRQGLHALPSRDSGGRVQLLTQRAQVNRESKRGSEGARERGSKRENEQARERLREEARATDSEKEKQCAQGRNCRIISGVA